MSKKLFFTVIIGVLLILSFVGWKFFLTPSATPVASNPNITKTDLFPFGQGATTPSQPKQVSKNTQISTSTDEFTTKDTVAKLRQLSKNPSASGAFFQNSSTSEALRFVDRATGHIIESAVDSNKQIKLSNVTISQIQEVFWDTKASTLIYRYLKDNNTIQSFYAAIKSNAASSTQPIEGIFLPTNIRSLALTNNKVFYFDPTIENGRLIVANADGSKKSIVWNSSFGEWAVSSNNPTKAFVYTKPSGVVKGVGYTIDTVKGTSVKIVGDIAGLEGTISPSGDYIFLSAAQGSTIASASYSLVKKTTLPLTINTLSSKCAWSNIDKKIIYCGVPAGITPGTYPDDWYKGSVIFSDRLWKINMETGETTVILDPFTTTSTNYDMTNLTVDPTDTYLSFVNKNDLTIWLYKLK